MNRAFAFTCYHRAVRAVGALVLIGTVAPAALAQDSTPTVTYPMTSAVTRPLWSMPQSPGAAPTGAPEERPLGRLPQRRTASSQAQPADQALQTGAGAHLPIQNQTNFGGIVQDGYIPPDPNIAVGPTDIVQVVNSEIAIFDKSGNMRVGYPKTLSSLWSALGGACGKNNAGDPVVQYDRFADRWLITQLGSVRSPYSECFAVSTTGDPEGGYNVYSYSFGTDLNDYPKFGVWPTGNNSAYLGTYNMFANGNTFSGAKLCAYDRQAMLSGASAAQVCFDISGDGGFLPSDVDGPTTPADGTPGYFLTWETASSLRLYKLSPDFTTPSNSTLSAFTDISVNSFSPACTTTTCAIVPQPGTSRQLDTLGDRLMNRLAYRIFGDHTSMVANHSVYSGQGSGVGVRWYELHTNGSGGFSVYQQSTFAPDANYRWMGSIAMDSAGNMALGYSRSASTTSASFNGYPSIYVAGRQSTDALNTIGAETVLQAGGGSQTGYTRWGDYTSLQIDPSDDCTFWYTNEYYPQTASYNWYTFIGSYKFSTCVSGAPTANFSLSEAPSPIAVLAGATNSGIVTVTSLNSFSSPVALTTTCPSGSSNLISCSLDPSSVTPSPNSSTNTTLNVAVNACTTSGSSSFSVTGNSGSETHSATFSINVTGQAFSLSASPASLTIPRGSSASVSIPVTNPSGSISLSVTGLPSRTSASFSPNPVVCPSDSATLTMKTNKRTPKGTYTLMITGNNGVTSASTQVNLTVN